MKRIDSFERFLESQRIEMISECALVLLPELESALVSAYKRGSADSSAIGLSNLAEELLAKRGKETGKDIAFADLDGDKIAFSTERSIWKEFPAEAGIGFSRGVADRQTALQAEKMSGRQKMNIGRWIKAIAGEGHADADVERLANFLDIRRRRHKEALYGSRRGMQARIIAVQFVHERQAQSRAERLRHLCEESRHDKDSIHAERRRQDIL